MSSNKQRGEKIMVIGTEEFLENDMELLNAAIRVYESDTGLLYACMRQTPDAQFFISATEYDCAMHKLYSEEYFEIRFMLACFIMLAYGEEI